jgi:hypothetical protein
MNHAYYDKDTLNITTSGINKIERKRKNFSWSLNNRGHNSSNGNWYCKIMKIRCSCWLCEYMKKYRKNKIHGHFGFIYILNENK